MKKTIHALTTAVLLVSSAAAIAQTETAQLKAILVDAKASNVLRAGTSVALKMSEELTTKGKNLRVGQRFMMEVAEPVTVQGHVVIPAGSPVTGEVTEVRNKGMWGKSGSINARVLFVRVDGRQIRMTGQLDDKGITGTGAVVGALVTVPLAGFFVTGTSALIPAGAPVKGFIDEDVAVAFEEGAAPAPLVVKATAAAAPDAVAPVPAPLVVTTSTLAESKPETCAQQAERMAPINPQTARSLEKKCLAARK